MRDCTASGHRHWWARAGAVAAHCLAAERIHRQKAHKTLRSCSFVGDLLGRQQSCFFPSMRLEQWQDQIRTRGCRGGSTLRRDTRPSQNGDDSARNLRTHSPLQVDLKTGRCPSTALYEVSPKLYIHSQFGGSCPPCCEKRWRTKKARHARKGSSPLLRQTEHHSASDRHVLMKRQLTPAAKRQKANSRDEVEARLISSPEATEAAKLAGKSCSCSSQNASARLRTSRTRAHGSPEKPRRHPGSSDENAERFPCARRTQRLEYQDALTAWKAKIGQTKQAQKR